MGRLLAHAVLCGVGWTSLTLSASLPLLAQRTSDAPEPSQGVISVPFIGCKSDGQVGPLDAPTGTSVLVTVGPEAAARLAYYSSAQHLGVLAPLGWHCFGIYGSGGESLYVTPDPIDWSTFGSNRGKLAGPAIQVSRSLGDTSGRFTVARIMARVFPDYWPLVTSLMQGFDLPASSFPRGPYPADNLTYKSRRVVEYRTPAHADGLGTDSWLEKSDSPIDGVAMLVGQDPDLMFLAVRLPPRLRPLTSAIIEQFERDAARPPR